MLLIGDTYLGAIYFRSKSFDDGFKLMDYKLYCSSNIETSSELGCPISFRSSEIERCVVEDFHLSSHLLRFLAYTTLIVPVLAYRYKSRNFSRVAGTLSISLWHLCVPSIKNILNSSSAKFSDTACSGNYECGFVSSTQYYSLSLSQKTFAENIFSLSLMILRFITKRHKTNAIKSR